MFVLDLLLLPLGAVIFPNPRVERVFIHAKVTRGLGNGLLRLDGQLHRAFLKCSGILCRSGLTHRTHLLGCVLSLVSVCPEEYSHIRTLRGSRRRTAGAKPYTMKVVRTVFNGGHEETYGNATRLVPTQQGFCWPTPQYRNWCAQHAFFEGKKAEETSPRKSTARTLKEVGQQYPSVL